MRIYVRKLLCKILFIKTKKHNLYTNSFKSFLAPRRVYKEMTLFLGLCRLGLNCIPVLPGLNGTVVFIHNVL